jgi:hypothetical protein
MKRILLLSLSVILFSFLVSSYSNGIGNVGHENRTGAQGSLDNCAGSGCHDANTSDVNINIVLRDMNDNVVMNNKYFPGAFYKIELTGNVYNGYFPTYGFQFAAATQNGSNAGTLSVGTGQNTSVVGSMILLEQAAPLQTVGPTNSYQTSTFLWHAPGTPTSSPGPITFFATVLAANDDGTRAGDKGNNEQRMLSPVASSVGAIDETVKTNIYPNPAKDVLNLSMENAAEGDYGFAVYNTNGQIKLHFNKHLNSSRSNESINVSDWATGTYYLEILQGERRRIIPIIKI